MPLYEYKCKVCGKITEQFLNIKERRKTVKCEYCNNEAVRVLSSGFFEVKGHNAKNGYHLSK